MQEQPEEHKVVFETEVGERQVDDVVTGPSKVFSGSVLFGGHAFSHTDAKRAGFFSELNPPEIGDEVVCFRKDRWHRQGVVTSAEPMESKGLDGLKAGASGIWVIVQEADGSEFGSWSAFLALADDKEYSSICAAEEFRESNFCKIIAQVTGNEAKDRLDKEEAHASLEKWLSELQDEDGEPVSLAEEMRAEIQRVFHDTPDPSLHLYSRHMKLGPRTSREKGKDYSLYYRALNNTLNHDDDSSLMAAANLVRRMMYLLLYDEETRQRRTHKGGRVWRGESERPVPLNMWKLREAKSSGSIIRFRQFQSTSSERKVAEKFTKGEDTRGFLWTIDIPPGFWGARDISAVSWKAEESETLFPPYAAFRVTSVDDQGSHLEAVDMETARDL